MYKYLFLFWMKYVKFLLAWQKYVNLSEQFFFLVQNETTLNNNPMMQK